MPSIDRTTIITGPAKITFGAQSFWSKGNVTLTPTNSRFKITTAHFGDVDERFSGRQIEVTFEPAGRFTAGLAAVLWPHAALAIGASIFGATDAALVINSRDGKSYTIHNAAVTKMPVIRASVGKTLIGPVTFTGLLKNSTDPSNAAAYMTVASTTYPGDTGFAVSDILTLAYSSSWGSAPWDSFLTEDGWEISIDMQMREQIVDGLGVVDMTLQNMTVSARCVPVGVTDADVLAKLTPAAALGTSVAAGAAALNISATGAYFRVYNAALVASDMAFGSESKRIGTTEWLATRTITAAVADPLFYVGTAAPA
jgi:hypothetical protein